MRRRRNFVDKQAESSWVLLAKQKNASLRVDLKEKLKSLEDEKGRIIARYQLRESDLERRMADVGYTRSMPLLLLNMIHLQRRLASHDISMNIVNCYLMHQEKAMQKLRTAIETNDGQSRSAAKDLDRQALHHVRFIRNAFEEAYNITADVGWTYGYDRSADIYEYGHTNHDMRCAAGKNAPVGIKTGAYPKFTPMNVGAYDPAHQRPEGRGLPGSEPTKGGLRARPPSGVRPRLRMYMRENRFKTKK